MAAHEDSRFVRIDRLAFGTLLTRLVSIALGGAIALGITVLGIETFREEPTWLTALSILIATGPIAAWGVYLASQSLLALFRQIGRLRSRIDLDAPEIVIPRRRPPRILPTLGLAWFIVFVTILTLSKLTSGEPQIAQIIGTAILLVLILNEPIRGLWIMWRLKASAFVPVVLDLEGFLDRSITDMPRIAWRDIASIDIKTGVLTLTGEIQKWAEARVPDRRWFAKLRARRTPRFRLVSNGLQPDGNYAIALIHAYWRRRLAESAADRMVPVAPTVQRA